MTQEQKRAHERLQKLPMKTHLRKWPEKRGNNGMSPSESHAAGRKGRLAARESAGY